jgi:hypothetical protein
MIVELFTVIVRDRQNGLHVISGVIAANRDAAIERGFEIAAGQGLRDVVIDSINPEGVSYATLT